MSKENSRVREDEQEEEGGGDVAQAKPDSCQNIFILTGESPE